MEEAQHVTSNFVKERETKKYIRFKEGTANGAILGTLYVSKDALKNLGDPSEVLIYVQKKTATA